MGRDERLVQLALLAGLGRVRSCVDTTTARLLAQLQRSTCGGRGFRNSHSSLRQTEYASRPAWGSVTVIQSLSLADFITSSCWMQYRRDTCNRSINIYCEGRMLMVDIMTLNGRSSMLDAPEIAALRSGLRGAVLLSGDEGYETARRVWNGNVDRHPAVIVRCMSASDVQRAVDFARK